MTEKITELPRTSLSLSTLDIWKTTSLIIFIIVFKVFPIPVYLCSVMRLGSSKGLYLPIIMNKKDLFFIYNPMPMMVSLILMNDYIRLS